MNSKLPSPELMIKIGRNLQAKSRVNFETYADIFT